VYLNEFDNGKGKKQNTEQFVEVTWKTGEVDTLKLHAGKKLHKFPFPFRVLLNCYPLLNKTNITRCGKCVGCTAKDCGICKYCMDSPKRGGINHTLQKPCESKVCTHLLGEEDKDKKKIEIENIYSSTPLQIHCNLMKFGKGAYFEPSTLPPNTYMINGAQFEVKKQLAPAVSVSVLALLSLSDLTAAASPSTTNTSKIIPSKKIESKKMTSMKISKKTASYIIPGTLQIIKIGTSVATSTVKRTSTSTSTNATKKLKLKIIHNLVANVPKMPKNTKKLKLKKSGSVKKAVKKATGSSTSTTSTTSINVDEMKYKRNATYELASKPKRRKIIHKQQFQHTGNESTSWTEEEMLKLNNSIQKYAVATDSTPLSSVDWSAIARLVGRSEQACKEKGILPLQVNKGLPPSFPPVNISRKNSVSSNNSASDTGVRPFDVVMHPPIKPKIRFVHMGTPDVGFHINGHVIPLIPPATNIVLPLVPTLPTSTTSTTSTRKSNTKIQMDGVSTNTNTTGGAI
jgi:hypothetical protein